MDPFQDNDLEELSAEYAPQKALERSWRWLVTVVLAVLVVAGVSYAVGSGLRRQATTSPAIHGVNERESLVLAETAEETALLLVGDGKTFTDIKAVSVTSETCIIQDIARGRSTILSGSLSPTGTRAAFIHERDGNRVVVFVELDTGAEYTLGSDELETLPSQRGPVEPCSWSSVTWDPSGTKLSFFGCDKDSSTLLVVDVVPEISPFVIKETRSSQELPRQVFWLNAEDLLYTTSGSITSEVEVNRVRACSECIPHLVYKK